MMGAVIENIVGGYLYPRDSVRRMLNADHGPRIIMLLLLLAFLVHQIMIIMVPIDVPGAEGLRAGAGIGTYIGRLIGTIISFAIMTTLVCYIGRAFGGKADFRQSALALAWYDVVTSVISPPIELAAHKNLRVMQTLAEDPEAPVVLSDAAALVTLVGGGVLLWLFAAFVAELHGFKRTLSVLAVLFAMMLLPAMFVTSLMIGA